MLKQRLLTVGVLLPIVLAAIWWLPFYWFLGFVSLVALWAAWEWGGFLLLTSWYSRGGYLLLILLAMGATFYIPINIV